MNILSDLEIQRIRGFGDRLVSDGATFTHVPTGLQFLVCLKGQYRLGWLTRAGVYVLVSREGEVLYIGQSQCIYTRLASHMASTISSGSQGWKEAHFMAILPHDRPIELETSLLLQIRTKYNSFK